MISELIGKEGTLQESVSTKMFRFTVWGDPNRTSMLEWHRWFEKIGVRSEVRTNPLTGQQALYREGPEHVAA